MLESGRGIAAESYAVDDSSTSLMTRDSINSVQKGTVLTIQTRISNYLVYSEVAQPRVATRLDYPTPRPLPTQYLRTKIPPEKMHNRQSNSPVNMKIAKVHN